MITTTMQLSLLGPISILLVYLHLILPLQKNNLAHAAVYPTILNREFGS